MKLNSLISAFVLMSIIAAGGTKGTGINIEKCAEDAVTHVSTSSTVNNKPLNNNTLTYEEAIKAGDVVEILYMSHNQEAKREVYNLDRLDGFVNDYKNGDNSKVRIVMYVNEDGKVWINKLKDLEYKGKMIKYVEYDTYSNPDKFIESSPYYFERIVKKDHPKDLWYGVCMKDVKSGKCGTLISVIKSDIIN